MAISLSQQIGPTILRRMWVYNLWWILGLGQLAAGQPAEPTVPPIDLDGQRYLSRVARRTVEQFAADETAYRPPYVPSSLENISCHVIVTLRIDGKTIGVGASGPGAVVPTLIESTVTALGGTDVKGLSVDSLCIEIEAIGEDLPVSLGEDGLNPKVVERVIEPGLEGFSVRGDGIVRTISPAELALKNQSVVAVLKSMVESIGHVPREASLSRRRSVHWYESKSGLPLVSLRRGMTFVSAANVTTESVDAAIVSLTDYLVQRLRSDGTFAYEYEPAAEKYSDRDNPVHQAGAMWALTVSAKRLPRSTIKTAADRAAGRLREKVTKLAGVPSASFVRTNDDKNPSAVTAQMLLAMLNGEPDAEMLDRLVAGLLWLQRSDGEFATAFPPAKRFPREHVYPSVTLLALAEAYKRQPSKNILTAFNRAFESYQKMLAERGDVEAVAWAIRPFARMAAVSNRAEFAEFAMRLADHLVARQLDASNCRWHELHGGIVATSNQLPRATTAICLSALVEAHAAAKKFGDERRAESYRKAAMAAGRFVMQLQFRKPEAYFLRLPEEAVGGIRSSVADSRIRIENIQHALLALIAMRDDILKLDQR